MSKTTSKKATTRKSPRQKAAESAARRNKASEQDVTADDGAQEAAGPALTQDASPAPAPDTAADTPKDGKKGVTIGELAERYLQALEAAGRSRGCVFSYSVDIALAVRHFGDKAKVATMTERRVTAFFESDAVTRTRTGKAKAAPTVAKSRRVFRQALEWAASEGLIEKAPISEKYLPRRKKAATATA